MEELRTSDVQARYSPIDFLDAEAPIQLWEEVATEWDLPRILVNNAAHSERELTFEELDADGLDAHYAVNLRDFPPVECPICPALYVGERWANHQYDFRSIPECNARRVGLCCHQGRD